MTTHEPETTDEPKAEPDDAGEPQVDDVGKPNREAAKWRTQLRETEAERDRLAEQVGRMRRGEVERLAANRLRDPGDLWLAEVEVASLLDDDGAPDPAKIDAAISTVLEEHPGWSATRRPKPTPEQGREHAPTNVGASWADALRGEG